MGAKHVSNGGACAACKHQRKKCEDECYLSNYFPKNKIKEFKSVHRVFGVSNLVKLIRANETTPAQQRAVATLSWEAEWREKEPAEGCFKEVMMLRCEIQRLREILARCNCLRPLDCEYWGLNRGFVFLKNNQQQVFASGLESLNQM